MDATRILITLIILIGLFFICRELLCWYWKINKSIGLQEEILEELKKLNRSGGNFAQPDAESGEEKTAFSKEQNPIVVEIKTGRQMRVREVTQDGKLVCYSGTIEVGTFSPDEVQDFEDWKRAK